jgi:pSer/pThr/pTyr-binding forkhead associated (FHA) protein
MSMQGLDSHVNLSQKKKMILIFRLVTSARNEQDQVYRFDKERIVIGSVISSNIRLQGQGVSPIHAVIEVRKDPRNSNQVHATIYDIASQTGLFVNQQKVITHDLKPNDVITLGVYTLKYSLEEFKAEDSLTHRSKEANSRVLFYDPQEDLKPLLLEEGRLVEEIFDYRPTSKRALEVVMSWCDTILDVKHFVDTKKVTLGNQFGADFGVPPILTESLFPIAVQQPEGYTLHIDGQMKGVIQKSGQLMTLAHACSGASRSAYGFEVSLGQHDFAKISVGDLDFYFSFTAAPPRLKKRRLLDRDPLFFKIFTTSMVFTLAFLIGLSRVNLEKEIDVEQVPDRIATILYQPEKFLPPPPPAPKKKEVIDISPEKVTEKKPLPKDMDHRKAQTPKKEPEKTATAPQKQAQGQRLAQEGEGARAKGAEGSRGDKNKKMSSDKVSQIARPTQNGNTSGAQAASQVPEEGNLDLLKGSGGKIQNLLGNTAINIGEGGGKLTGFGNFSTGGSGGLAIAGSGQGGGGTAENTLGGLGRKGSGLGRVGTGAGVAGAGTGIVGNRVRVDIVGNGPDEVVVQGSIDRDAVAEAILAHRDEFAYCYEKEINAENPNLSGVIISQFEIGSSGKVTQAGVSSSSMKNANVEGCVVKVLKRIQFPTPVGGAVEVRFPFKFHPSANR